MLDPSQPLLIITHDDTTLHVGPADVCLQHVAEALGEPPPGPDPGPVPRWEMFDGEGRELTIDGVADEAGRVASLHPLRQVPPRLLLDRIDRALDQLQRMLDAHPELGSQGPNVPPVVHVPRPAGTLPQVLDSLSTKFDLHTHPNRGNYLHMLAHAAGVAHR